VDTETDVSVEVFHLEPQGEDVDGDQDADRA
jgi:hypothetical protein